MKVKLINTWIVGFNYDYPPTLLEQKHIQPPLGLINTVFLKFHLTDLCQ